MTVLIYHVRLDESNRIKHKESKHVASVYKRE